MRTLIAIGLLSSSLAFGALQEPPKSKPSDQQRKTEQRGSEESPLVIKLAGPNTEAEGNYETYEKYEKPKNERRITTATIALAWITGALAFFTALLWFATYRLSSDAKENAVTQVKKMEDAIAESVRAANAMEEVAEATKNNAVLMQSMVSRQMRAYLSVVIGNAIYQERDKNLKFAGTPNILNTGLTPARKVRHLIRAEIMPTILPFDFDFSLHGDMTGGGIIGSQQRTEIPGVVDDFVANEDVPDIKHAVERALHVWGIVIYEDVFGNEWETKFSQVLTWLGPPDKEIVYGYYNNRYNEQT
jgi:hypothetical protein